jgi:glutamate dehydrogenase
MPAFRSPSDKRLFEMPRSSWQDYDRTKLISEGGGMIVPRTQKSVVLSEEAAAALGLPRTAVSPVQIMKAILKADVDLLWFGGIGTYVKASAETNQDAGDRANDAIRIDAADLRVKVIGEGANLGVTQRGRIEYGLRGGACNSDAIDNSGGVNSSDVEVNIKIALASAMRGGRLTRPSRDELLETMTQDVASLVLENNYQQTLALSLQQHRGLADLPHQARFMTSLEARGLLDRAVEFLPSNAALAERQARGEALTRAELGVLLAYAKIALMIDLVDSDIPDDPYFERGLLAYFPEAMRDHYAAEIAGHRLRREIIARQVANDLVNRGGPTFVSRLQDATGRTTADVVRTFVIVRDGFALDVLYSGIDALDTRIDGEAQLDLYASVGRVLFDCTGWSLRNDHSEDPVGDRIAVISAARSVLGPQLREMMPEDIRARLERRQERYLGAGAPPELAEGIALTMAERLVPGIAHVARQAGVDMVAAARAFYAVADAFRLSRIEEGARSIAPTDYYDGLALGRALDMLDSAARAIAAAALAADGGEDPVARWLDAGGERVAHVRERLRALTESGDISVSRLSVAAGLMHDLAAS